MDMIDDRAGDTVIWALGFLALAVLMAVGAILVWLFGPPIL
jgi:hypothetical protein